MIKKAFPIIRSSKRSGKAEWGAQVFIAYYSIDYIDQAVKVFPLNGRQTDIKDLKIKKEEPLKKELQNFIQCIGDGKIRKVSGEEGLRALKLAHKVLAEIET